MNRLSTSYLLARMLPDECGTLSSCNNRTRTADSPFPISVAFQQVEAY
jgi:hypothetical protein